MFSNKNEGIEILKNLNIDINIRPEKLKLEDYANLTKLIMKKRNLK